MRFVCALLIGLIALSSVCAGQSLRSGSSRLPQKGLSQPKAPSIVPRGPSRTPQKGWSAPNIPSVVPRGPAIVPVPRVCPKGTTGAWPNCVEVAKPGGKSCPEGQVRKLRGCVDRAQDESGPLPRRAKTGDRACPEGQVRKFRHCVEVAPRGAVTTTRPAPVTPAPATPKAERAEPAPPAPPTVKQAEPTPLPPPPTPKSRQAEPVPPEIAALIAGRPHRPDEVLVLVDTARAGEIAARLAAQYGVTAGPGAPIALLDRTVVRLTLKPGQSLESLLGALSTDPDVDLAQPNYVYQASKGPATPENVPQYAAEAIRLEEAHRLARGQGVMIAVIDTAIEATHPELAGSVAGVFDAGGGTPCEPEPHGTGIAGILVAHGRLVGAAPESKFLAVCAFHGAGDAGAAESTSLPLLKGIDWGFDAGAKVMNMSFTGPLDPLLERIVTAAAERGVVFVAAAGNNGPKAPPVYPAAYSDVIAVTATDDKDLVYRNANQGNYISIAAPGVDIVVPGLNGTYALSSGTSMAAAHVSGVVALMLERNGALDPAGLRDILISSARMPEAAPDKEAIGAGIVDAASAAGHAQQAPADTVSAGP